MAYDKHGSMDGAMKKGHSGAMGKKMGGKAMKAMHEKCGFPKAELPGKTQPRDRSAGVKRCPTTPDCKGM